MNFHTIMHACRMLCLVLFSTVSIVEAHPGMTASDGCHYCRTNCDYWGRPYGERHCHSAVKKKPSKKLDRDSVSKPDSKDTIHTPYRIDR